MLSIPHPLNDQTALEIQTETSVLHSEQDALRLMEEMFNHSARSLILPRAALAPEFFQLRSGLAGAVLQKFVNYQIRVAIVGDFSDLTSDSWQAFIYESNRGTQVCFVESAEAALQKWSAV